MDDFKDFDRIQVLLADIDVSSVKLDRIANQDDRAEIRASAGKARARLVDQLTAVLSELRLTIKALK